MRKHHLTIEEAHEVANTQCNHCEEMELDTLLNTYLSREFNKDDGVGIIVHLKDCELCSKIIVGLLLFNQEQNRESSITALRQQLEKYI